MKNSREDPVDLYFKRLKYWKEKLGLKGYSQQVFKRAQDDLKK